MLPTERLPAVVKLLISADKWWRNAEETGARKLG
jgi:hypothetical protein